MRKFQLIDTETSVCRDIEMLQPRFRAKIEWMQIILADLYSRKLTPSNFQVFETWRHPHRQTALGKETIAAPGWRSAHQYGLAADFAALDDATGWSWDGKHDWSLIGRVAKEVGLNAPVTGDPGHVEHPIWPSIRQFLR